MSNLASNAVSVLGGAALGGIAAYLLDPDRGPARRREIASAAGDAVTSAGDTAKSLAGAINQYTSQFTERGGNHSVRETGGSAADQARREFSDSIQSLIDRAKEYAGQIADRGQAKARELSDRAKSSVSRQTGWEPARPRRTIAGMAVGTLGTLALGAGVMFFMDPARGRSRRAWAGQKISSWARHGSRSATRYTRHMENKIKGAAARAKHAMPEQWSKSEERVTGAASDAARDPGNSSITPPTYTMNI